jgi:hypothetical protein
MKQEGQEKMLFHLDYNGDDIYCEKCETRFHINWGTEYGDPLFGDHSTKCLKCGNIIHFEVYIQYSQ